MAVTMRFEGGDQLAKTLASLSIRVAGKIQRDALQKGAEPIRARASADAARATGAPDLADHIVIGSGRVKHIAASIAVGPSREARSDQPDKTFGEQGFYVEYGTSDTAAQPFMRPAHDVESPKAVGVILREMWQALIRRGFSTRGSSSGGGLV